MAFVNNLIDFLDYLAILISKLIEIECLKNEKFHHCENTKKSFINHKLQASVKLLNLSSFPPLIKMKVKFYLAVK